MRILFLGDVVGRSGRDAVIREMPRLRLMLDVDFVIVNGENAAHGFGITDVIARDLLNAGADVITTGNHIWDKREIMPFIDRESRLIRPLNYPDGAPGRGYTIQGAESGKRVLVINAMARLFMDPLDDPFAAVDRVLSMHRLGPDIDAIVLDFHGEATSEKMCMGHFCDGRVTLVVGTHSHVPTADLQILPGGTGYQSDAGMCGDYDSVIGMVKGPSIQRFVRKLPTERLSPAEGPATLCGIFVETDEATGLAKRVEPVRLGGRLAAHMPRID